ncbi:calcium-binding protein [uncultured Methylobacterium sp.]|uniref:calcium-binding protein n=1 Tax=uncultured Methylobacterium sp. TaxID=157278 RepID=UPI00261E0373|nr:calcium-binding protein [uncultured Methylobacterium sp.]
MPAIEAWIAEAKLATGDFVMATSSYYFTFIGKNDQLNTYTQGYQYASSIATLNNGGFFSIYEGYYVPFNTADSYSYVLGRVLDARGVPTASGEFAAANYGPGQSALDAQAATLTNGNVVVASTSSSSSTSAVSFGIYSSTGSLISSGTAGTGINFNADVARLTDGGFVISYDHQYSSTDLDSYATIFNADGTVRANLILNAETQYSNQSAVAGLSNGGFVVSYARETAVGSGSYQLGFQIYNANGGLVRGETIGDASGTSNVPGGAVGLRDGGFAVVYRDNGWAGNDDVSLGIWNADGSLRTIVQANAPMNTAGYQYGATVAQLDNGFIAVGWTNGTSGNTDYSIWTPGGAVVTSGVWRGTSRNIDFAAAANGVLSGIVTDTIGDGDAYSVASNTLALTRNSQGNANAEAVTGDSLRDYMMGYDGNDTLLGLGADDTLDGGAGRDSVDGGIGNDLIYGSAGADTLIGGAGIDTLSYLSSVAAVTLDLATPGANTGDAAGDLVSGFELVQGTSYNDRLSGDAAANNIDGADGNDLLFGRAGADSLTGGYGNDTLDGGADNDRLDGGSNDDLLIGGLGADSLIGKDGVDTASYAGAAAAVTANLLAPAGNTGEAAGDTYSGVEGLIGSRFNDRLTGNTAANRLEGGLGNDTLDGGAANDTLIGGEGADWLTASAGYDLLTGGAAGDRFVFTSVSPQFDTISDFDRLQGDRIVLASAAFGGLTGLTAGTSFIAKGAPMATQSGPTVLYDTGTGLLSYDADGTGAGAATRIATLTGAPTVLASSFVFV